jgi:hypothetical protein
MEPLTTPENLARAYRVRSVGGGWEVFDDAGRSLSERMRTQADAVAHSKELARRDGSAQVLVYDEHGKLASEFFYQREERRSLAYDDSTPTAAAAHPTTAGAVDRDPRSRGA